MRIKKKSSLWVLVPMLALALAGCRSGRVDIYEDPSGATGGTGRTMLGIDVLRANGYRGLLGKRVGLITNQTSRDGSGTKTRLVLHRAREVNLTELYVPEHGLEGTEKAGQKIQSRRDSLTGLTAHSLYGATRKPTASMLRNIDILVFDLQDIGCRSYTYISTMALAMEAAAEHGKEFMVLDRPNPLGGIRVEGPPLENRWKSFVGQIPTPYVHGMTAGELAGMINGKRWIRSRPNLIVVKMRSWSRSRTWSNTGLRWYPTSPNIPKGTSPLYYVATGILGGLSGLDIGIGTSRAFEFAAAKGVDPNDFTNFMNRQGFSGVRFTPYRSSKKAGYGGCQIHIDPRASADLVALDVVLVSELNRRTGGALFRDTPSSSMNLFHKVYGSDSFARDMQRGRDPRSVIAEWQSSRTRFLSERQQFLLYP